MASLSKKAKEKLKSLKTKRGFASMKKRYEESISLSLALSESFNTRTDDNYIETVVHPWELG